MSENQNIEAKLCSYIEGDLDAEGRAEIEKYLLANPQYRPLIAELSRTRGLLRGLPRASAPSDLLETLSGQIERSVLLGDDDRGSMKIRSTRMPQIAAWAAVLLLTAGLAAVIYRVLPANKTQPEVALLKPAPAPNSPAPTVTEEAEKPLPNLDKSQVVLAAPEAAAQAPAQTLAVTGALAAGAPSAADVATQPALGADEQVATTFRSAGPSDALPATSPAIVSADASASSSFTGSALAGGTTVGNGSSSEQQFPGSIVSGDATQLGQNMYVTLHATDAKAADARVAQYLNQNGIRFESRADSGSRISSGPLTPLSPSSYAMSGTNSVTPPAAVPSVGTRSDAKTPGAGAPADGAAARRMFGADRSPTDIAATPAQLAQAEAGSVIIARNLTPDQAKQLTNDLAVKFLPTDVTALQPAAMDQIALGGKVPLQTGQRVRIVAKDNGLPGVEAMNEPQTIDADGNLTLPLVGKVKAAGLTEADLAEKIPQAYRDAKSPTSATWTIERIASTEPASVSPATDAKLSLTPTIEAKAQDDVLPATMPVASVLDKDRQAVGGGVGGSSGGGGFGGGGGGAAAGDHQGIDVTIRVIAQNGATTAPATQQILPPADSSTPYAKSTAAHVAAPLATMPTSAPTP